MLGFLAGLTCGAGTALLLAPMAGRRTRAMLAHKAREQADQIKDQAADLRDSATEILQQAGRKYSALRKA
jgi:gas vesicle protein